MNKESNLISAYMASIAKKRWQNKSKKERSEYMKQVRRGGKVIHS